MSMNPMSSGGPPVGPRPPYGPPVGAVPVGSIGVRPPYVGSPQGPPGPGPMMSGGPPPGSSPQGMPRPQMVNLPHRQNQGKSSLHNLKYFFFELLRN